MGDIWDWVEDKFHDVVDWFSDIIEDVVDFVTDLVTDIVSWIVDNISYVLPGFDDIFYDLIEVFYDIWSEVGEYIQPLVEVLAQVFQMPIPLTHAIIEVFEDLLEAIHLNEMEVAAQVSDEVREVWWTVVAEIEKEIEEWARKREWPPFIMSLVLRITRNHVLQVSTLLGRPYLVAEVEWIGALHRILRVIQHARGTRLDSLTRVYRAIDEIIYKPYSDTKSALARSWFGLFEALLNTSSGMNDSIENVQAAVDDILGKLPEQIKSGSQDAANTHRNEVNQWRLDTYFPDIHGVRDWLDILTGKTNDNTSDIQGVVDRILNPAKYLEEIEDQPPEVIEDSEDTLTDLSHRRYARDSDALSDEAEGVYEDLAAKRALGTIPVVVKSWETPKIVDIKPKPVEPLEPRLTWYVGDY